VPSRCRTAARHTTPTSTSRLQVAAAKPSAATMPGRAPALVRLGQGSQVDPLRLGENDLRPTPTGTSASDDRAVVFRIQSQVDLRSGPLASSFQWPAGPPQMRPTLDIRRAQKPRLAPVSSRIWHGPVLAKLAAGLFEPVGEGTHDFLLLP